MARFDGTAGARRGSGAARRGPLVRLELAALPRLTLGLELGAEMLVVPMDQGDSAAIEATVAPRGGLDATCWLR